jgi:EAL domain-containing protein (putative c-di-GMP-specific phosphodiesterase class I)
MRLLAELLRDLQRRARSSAQAVEERDRLRRAITDVIDGRGRHAVLQPVIDLTTGRAVAAEGLTRFTAPSPVLPAPRTTAQWFDDAARLGLRQSLEVATAESVLDLLGTPDVPADVAVTVNLGPQTITSQAFAQLLAQPAAASGRRRDDRARAGQRLRAARRRPAPYRAGGLRVAVDDAGAGYASLRHVLAVQPDLLKVDMALIRGVDTDVARQTLLRALSSFAGATGCQVVAEGVETAPELRAVRACGVRLAQGHLLARPSATPSWEFSAV